MMADGHTPADGNWCQQFCTPTAALGLAKHVEAETGACFSMGYAHVKTTITQRFFDGNTSNPNYNCNSIVFDCPDDEHSYYMDKGDDCLQMCAKKLDHPLNNVLGNLTGLFRGKCKHQQDQDDIEMCNYIGNASALLFVDGSVESGVLLRGRASKLYGGLDGNHVHSLRRNRAARARARARGTPQKVADDENSQESHDGGPESMPDTAHKNTGAAGDDDAGDSQGDAGDDDDDADAGVAADGQDDGSDGSDGKAQKNNQPLANDDAGDESSSVAKNANDDVAADNDDKDVAADNDDNKDIAADNDDNKDVAADDDNKDVAADNDDTTEAKDSEDDDMKPSGKSSSVGKKSTKTVTDDDGQSANIDTYGEGDADADNADDAGADSQDDSSDASPHKDPQSSGRTNSGSFVRKETH